MSLVHHTSCRLHAMVAVACAVWLIACAGGARAQDLRPGNPLRQSPAGLRRTLFEQRSREAAAKVAALEAAAPARIEATPNQMLYDVHAYDLTFTVDTLTQTITGFAVIRAGALAPISTMDLDLNTTMVVSAVTAGGAPAAFVHAASHVLTVTLDRTYNAGETVEVTVAYAGNPSGFSFRWTSWKSQAMVWTLSEPYGAPDWWPCKNLNTDKADSVDVRVTVPANMIAGSNGVLVSNVFNGATRTFHWRSRYPIAPYLVSLAIYPYATYSDAYAPIGGGDPMPVEFYVFPDQLAQVTPTFALTVPMIQTFAAHFGEYPFVSEKYGHAQILWGGAMEHQTLTSLGYSASTEDVIAHELAHQWWGDLVTCADFHHIWLNEGFATWAEAFWHEQKDGPAAYRAMMKASTYYGPGTVYVADTTSFGRIFDANLTYNKGSWVVHMLRGVVGDPAFFAGLAAYRAQYGYGSATTEQFRDVMEAVSGIDLHPFFQEWVYGQYVPDYRTTWSWSAGTLQLTIEQVQTDTGLFTMPIPVRITTASGTTDVTLQNSMASETYSIGVADSVLAVRLDPDDWILNLEDQVVTNPTFDHGILLVNGVDWTSYETALTSAYMDGAFQGGYNVSFWDVFDAPAGGYPANLPAPLGHGAVPVDTLKQFSSLIWVGDAVSGDLQRWQETAILPYLEAGGNVLLMSRMTASYLGSDLTTYAGVTWADKGVTFQGCSAVDSGLVDMPITGDQNWNDDFDTTVAPDADLLFIDPDRNRGIGVHRQQPGGGTDRASGAHFAVIAGRPYRWDHTALATNVGTILDHYFGEVPAFPVATGIAPQRLVLRAGVPNPFASRTTIGFSLPRAGPARLAVYDASGRLVRTLVDGARTGGGHQVVWNATDDAGRAVRPGTYFMRLEAAGAARTRSLVLVR